MAQTPLGFCKITIADVDYLEAQNKQVLVHLSNGTTLQIREQFTRCEEAFTEERGFFRCHRSYIINLRRIHRVRGWNSFEMTNGDMVPVGKLYQDSVKDAVTAEYSRNGGISVV